MLAQRRRQLRAGFKRAETGPTGSAEGDQSPNPVPSHQQAGRFRRVGAAGSERQTAQVANAQPVLTMAEQTSLKGSAARTSGRSKPSKMPGVNYIGGPPI